MRVAAGARHAGGEIDLRRLSSRRPPDDAKLDRAQRDVKTKRAPTDEEWTRAGIRLEGGEAREVERDRLRARRARRSGSARAR